MNQSPIYKRCPSGQRRNRKSGLCEPKRSINPVRRPRCPSGQLRNRKSGLCEPKRSINPVRRPRCPSGQRRNRRSGLCEPKSNSVRKRCPSGQRRNRRSGLCEPKKTPTFRAPTDSPFQSPAFKQRVLDKTISLPCVMASQMTPRPYQLQAIDHMQDNFGLLVWFEVGTGKTITAVIASQCYLRNYPNRKVFIVTPTSLIDNFKKELQKYGDQLVHRDQYHIITEHYFTYKLKLDDISQSMLIIDEAHHLRKQKGDFYNKTVQVVDVIDKLMLLTGTPLINTTSDIFVYATLLSRKNFSKEKEAVESLAGNIIIVKKPEESDDYPSVIYQEHTIKMSNEHYARYNDVISQYERLHGHSPENFRIGYRQAIDYIPEIENPKIQWVISEIKAHPNELSVIYTPHIQVGVRVLEPLLTRENIPFFTISGATPPRKRQDYVNRFNDYERRVLLISSAGSEGLDLKGVRHIYIISPPWTQEDLNQIVGRGVRYKSHVQLPLNERNVTIHLLKLLAPVDTFDNPPYESGDVLIYDNMDKKQLALDNLAAELAKGDIRHLYE